MATRRIVELGDEKLRKVCKPIQKYDLRLRLLLKDMADTMYRADGVGLAAPQVGILRRVVVVDVGDGLIELINPEIVASSGENCDAEGCLSLPGRSGYVTRPQTVTVRAFDRAGKPIEVEGVGFKARALCHEIDHLNGVLYIDLMEQEILSDDEPVPEKVLRSRAMNRRADAALGGDGGTDASDSEAEGGDAAASGGKDDVSGGDDAASGADDVGSGGDAASGAEAAGKE